MTSPELDIARRIDQIRRAMTQAHDAVTTLQLHHAVGQLLSLLEARPDLADHVPQDIPPAWVLGLTGPPGAGKSTLAARLVSEYLTRTPRVAVLAVDPSAIHGGAFLGDRVRFDDVTDQRQPYLRSVAARGALGGLSLATPALVHALRYSGFDLVVVETVGVGQSEVAIADLCDTLLTVLTGHGGDVMQLLKSGLLDHGDVFAINKSDLGGAATTQSALGHAMALTGRQVDICQVSAASDEPGVAPLIGVLDEHQGRWGRAAVAQVGAASVVRQRVLAQLLRAHVQRAVDDVFEAGGPGVVAGVVDELSAGTVDMASAVRTVLGAVGQHPGSR